MEISIIFSMLMYWFIIFISSAYKYKTFKHSFINNRLTDFLKKQAEDESIICIGHSFNVKPDKTVSWPNRDIFGLYLFFQYIL